MKLRDIRDRKVLLKALYYAVSAGSERPLVEILDIDLYEAFSFSDTDEGGGFWSKLYNDYIKDGYDDEYYSDIEDICDTIDERFYTQPYPF